MTLWKCDPSNIQNCLNCQYAECINFNSAAKDNETDELEKEAKIENTRINTKNRNHYEWFLKNKDKCYERTRQYRATPRAKQLRRERDALNKAIKEERNKGYIYGYISSSIKMPKVSEIAQEFELTEVKVRLYLNQFVDEHLIDYREEIKIY